MQTEEQQNETNQEDFSFEGQISIPWVDLEGWADAKNQLFQNSVILHITLKGMKQIITCWQIFCPYTHL